MLLLLSMIIALLNHALWGDDSLPPKTSALAKRALAYIHQNYHRQYTRQEFAAAIGTSENYLTDVFHRELQLSPWEYLNRYRIMQAKNKLASTNLSIREVAYQVGFVDPSYFGRVFRQQVGISPSSFRKKG